MDIPRKSAARNRLIRRIVYIVILVAAGTGITLYLNQLKPAAPSVERSTVWIDTVKRGPLLIQVRGLGTLVPEEILWIPAIQPGRVKKIILRPGVNVREDTILLELSNPELELAAFDAEWQLKQADAAYTDLKVKLEQQRLDQQANTARVKAEFHQAKLTADRDAALVKLGLKSDLEYQLSKTKAEELVTRLKIEEERTAISGASVDAQLASQKVQIEKLRANYALKRTQVDDLKVRAGAEGVLQELPVEVGQQMTPGAVLAKVAQPWKLKAVLKIAETQAKDVQIGQVASIDTRNGVIPGKVARIDPAVQQGTVTVDVRLEGELPQGARPDLSVDGVVDIERMDDVVYVGRPVFGQPNSTVGLFRLDPSSNEATRVQVKLGKSSVNTIAVLDGLKVGDQVILSDMQTWDAHPRVRLN